MSLKDIKKLKCLIDECNFPTKKGEWLSSLDIDYIMKKVEKKYKKFKYIGTFPIDFQKLYPNILKKTNEKYALILNTSSSNEEGEHWISLFVDGLDKSICFFDSNGLPPPNIIQSLINKINKKENYNIYINYHKKQKKDGNCGLFAINFILQKLAGISCLNIFNNNDNDEKMDLLRKKLFNIKKKE